jgi:tetratricopeptide (TPR) repeat protein
MTLRTRIRLLWLLVTLLLCAGSFALARVVGWDPTRTALWFVIPLGLTLVALQIALVRASQRRLQRALSHGDVSAVRHELAELVATYRGQPRVRELLRSMEANLLVLEERYPEARALLESIDQSVIGEERLPMLQSQLAWCMAHVGDAEPAVELARAALGRAQSQPVDVQAYCQGALGVAYVLAGKPAQALPLLSANAEVGGARNQSARAFYLGEALRAEGRMSEARAAYDRAAAIAPEGPFGKRARVHADELTKAQP